MTLWTRVQRPAFVLPSAIHIRAQSSTEVGKKLSKLKRKRWWYAVGVLGVTGGILGLVSMKKFLSFAREKRREKKNLKPTSLTLQEAMDRTEARILKLKDQSGCPGVSAAVSVDGKPIWSKGYGYADVENKVAFKPCTVMKIASVSKLLTTTVALKLWEMDCLNVDAPVTDYVKTWPEKTWQGQQVKITPRQLLSHLGGIRDYRRLSSTPVDAGDSEQELAFEEYYIKDKYKNIQESLKLFKDDPLISEPGMEFHYTTHGFTLLSAVLEGASGHDFSKLLYGLAKDLGLENTCLDEKERLIYHRASYYQKNANGELRNAPFSESSFRWAGAGMLSNVQDLIKFGNVLLYSYQYPDTYVNITETKDASKRNFERPSKSSKQKAQVSVDNNRLPSAEILKGYLTSSTVRRMWSPVPGTKVSWHPKGAYGLGCQIIPLSTRKSRKQVHKSDHDRVIFGHTGGTVGSSCVLFILPKNVKQQMQPNDRPPKGIVVAIMMNLHDTGLSDAALEITTNFDNVKYT